VPVELDPLRHATNRPGAIGRRIIVGNPLDHDAATVLCAELMTLDGQSADPVDLLISGGGGPIDSLFPIIDTINTMRAAVNTRATGLASGTAGCLVALGSGHRAMAAPGLLSVRLQPGRTEPEQRSSDLDRLAATDRQRRQSLAQMLAARCGVSIETMTTELENGELYSPTDAISRRLVDPPRS